LTPVKPTGPWSAIAEEEEEEESEERWVRKEGRRV